MTDELFQTRIRLLKLLGWIALVGVLLLALVAIAFPENLALSRPTIAVAAFSVAPAMFYLVLVVIWHWKGRYRGTHSDLWGALLLLEVSGWLKLVYLFRHVIPDARGTGRYARTGA